MDMYTIVCGPLDTNCYIAAENGVCAVIDPSEAEPVIQAVEEHGLKVAYILLTHGHFDHIGGVVELREKTGAKVMIHGADEHMVTDGRSASRMGVSISPFTPDTLLEGGETLGEVGIRVIHTPGHSPGSVCFVHEKSRTIFAGDTLFRLNVGRADLLGSSPYELHSSIKEKLFTLEGDYEVYPGHMRKTTLEFERAHNPYMKRTPDQW